MNNNTSVLFKKMYGRRQELIELIRSDGPLVKSIGKFVHIQYTARCFFDQRLIHG
jgi:hypothetical protein